MPGISVDSQPRYLYNESLCIYTISVTWRHQDRFKEIRYI